MLGQAPDSGENKPREYVTAAASRDTAPRIGLIPSSFTGTEEMDGRKIRGLTRPVPVTDPLQAAQLDDMLQLAVELGGGRRGGLHTAIGADDWVVVKINVQACPDRKGFHPGAVTDPRLVAGVLRYLAGRNLGRRFTIVERSTCRSTTAAAPLRWEDTNWNGAFDGLSYHSVIDSLAKQYPKLRFELLDLHDAPSLRMPVEGRVHASRNPQGIYQIPRLLRECDKVISIAPLSLMAGSGIALSMINYLGFAQGDLPSLGDPGEVALDLFSFHPADYAIVGGSFAAEWGGATAPGKTRARRHNVVIAGNSALAVDAIGAAVMGLESESIRHLELAVKRGYGTNDSYSIWTRGVEVEEAKAEFEKPAV
jgi:hypothetical protein